MAKRIPKDELSDHQLPQLKKRRRKRGRRVGLILLVMIALLLLSFAATKLNLGKYWDMVKMWKKAQKQSEQTEAPEELPLVKVFHVVKLDFKDNLPVVGTVKGHEELELRFEANGVVEKFFYQEGELVTKDSIIAQLNQSEAKYKMEYQKANYETAQSTFLGAAKKLSNSEKMFEAGAIIVSKLDEAVLEAENAALKMKSARFEYLSAENELRKTLIKTPIDGVLAVKHMDEGEFVSSNDKVVTLFDISKVRVHIGVVEKDIDKIAIGLTATISVDTYPDTIFEGVIVNMWPVIEGKSRTLTAEVEVENEELRLLPGMFARTQVAVYEAKDAIMIPSVALNKTKEGYTVNVIDEEDLVETRPVEVSYTTIDLEHVQVSAGLDVDEFIVIESPQEIKDGDKVQVIEVQESTLV